MTRQKSARASNLLRIQISGTFAKHHVQAVLCRFVELRVTNSLIYTRICVSVCMCMYEFVFNQKPSVDTYFGIYASKNFKKIFINFSCLRRKDILFPRFRPYLEVQVEITVDRR